jgi:hypothetical protein
MEQNFVPNLSEKWSSQSLWHALFLWVIEPWKINDLLKDLDLNRTFLLWPAIRGLIHWPAGGKYQWTRPLSLPHNYVEECSCNPSVWSLPKVTTTRTRGLLRKPHYFASHFRNLAPYLWRLLYQTRQEHLTPLIRSCNKLSNRTISVHTRYEVIKIPSHRHSCQQQFHRGWSFKGCHKCLIC